MNFELDYPFVVRLDQIEELPSFRDGEDGIRSKSISQKWHQFENATINGELQEHHLYLIVSRERARFSALKDFTGQHFLYDPRTLNSPVAINFESLSDSQNVIDGTFDLSDPSLCNTLLDAFNDSLRVDQLSYILGEPHTQAFAMTAKFGFKERNICVPLSPDLWRFIRFPFHIPGEVPNEKFPFDYRIEYIGISGKYAEERLAQHAHIRRIQTALASQTPNREAFAIMYQVDFENDSGITGCGNLENILELEAAEAILIQHFKPRYNMRSVNFSLTEKNSHILDEHLANRMRASGDYIVGGTQFLLRSPAEHDKGFSLYWGRFFTDHRDDRYKTYHFYF